MDDDDYGGRQNENREMELSGESTKLTHVVLRLPSARIGFSGWAKIEFGALQRSDCSRTKLRERFDQRAIPSGVG